MRTIPAFPLRQGVDVQQDWLLRGLTEDDRDLMCAHLHGLPPGLRYLRFGHLYPDAALDDIVADFDFASDLFCGVLSPRRELVGLVQAAPDPNRCYELAFSVLPDWQLNGFALALGERVLRMLASRGARAARIRCLRSNEAMMGLADRLGFSLTAEGVMARGERLLERPGVRSTRGGVRLGLDPAR